MISHINRPQNSKPTHMKKPLEKRCLSQSAFSISRESSRWDWKEIRNFHDKVLELSLVQLFKMADDSSAVPIWCDVGKNLNAAYLIVSLRGDTRGKPSDDGNSKKTVKIYSRYLTYNNPKVNTGEDGDTERHENTVLYPGKHLCLLFENSLEDANEFPHTCIIDCLNRHGEISYFSNIVPQTLSTMAFASMTAPELILGDLKRGLQR